MAYDAADGYLLLIGTCDSSTLENETWTFVPANSSGAGNWTQLPTNRSMPSLEQASLAYDPATKSVIDFGGIPYANYTTAHYNGTNETWSFAQGHWTRVPTTTAPSPRWGAPLAYDNQTGSLILYGGTGANATGVDTALNDTWSFANGTWTSLRSSGLPGTVGYSGGNPMIAYDSTDRALVLLGGYQGAFNGSTGRLHIFNGTWRYSNGSWLPYNGTGLYYHSSGTLTDDPAAGELVLTQPGTPVVWTFSGGNWTLHPNESGPVYAGSAGQFTTAYDPAARGVFAFAGQGLYNGTLGADEYLWLERGGNWSAVNGTLLPLGRSSAAMAYDPAEGYDLLFGGYVYPPGTAYGAWWGDTWANTNGTWTELHPATSPAGRSDAGLVWDGRDRYMLLYGGYDYSGLFHDTWIFRNGSWTELYPAQYPDDRYDFGFADDPADGYVLFYGGVSDNGSPRDTWTFANGTWTNITSLVGTPPPVYAGMSMVYDARDGYVLMFGGTSPFGWRSVTWKFSGGKWTNITASVGPNPPPRQEFPMVYDSAGGYALLMGGRYGGWGLTDTWAFLAGRWTNLTSNLTASPLERCCSAMAYDASSGSLLLVGGTYDWDLAGNWLWSWEPKLAIQSLDLSVSSLDLNQSVSLRVLAYGGTGALSYRWSGLPADCPGANNSTLSCTPTNSSDPGKYNVSVTVTDGANSSAAANASLHVYSDPTLSSPSLGRSQLDVNQTVKISVNASGGLTPYSIAWAGLPTGCASTSALTFNCTPSASGNFSVQASLTDADGYSSVGGNASMIVHGALSLSKLASNRSKIDSGQSLTLHASVTGGLGPYSYLWSGLAPLGCTGSGAVVNCSPQLTGSAKEVNVSVTANDSLGAYASSGVVRIWVYPALSAIGLRSNRTDDDVGVPFNLSAAFSGGASPASETWLGLPLGCGSQNATSLECVPNATGTWNVTATVRDATGAHVSLGPIQLAISAALSVSLAPSRTELDVGQTVDLTLVGLGGRAPYSVAWGPWPAGCFTPNGTLSGAMFTAACAPSVSGSFAISLRLTDANDLNATAASGTLRVDPRLQVLSITAVPEPDLAGRAVMLTTSVSGGRPAYGYTWSGLPTGCTSSSVAQLTCVPSGPELSNISVTVADQNSMNVTSAPTELRVDPLLAVGPVQESRAQLDSGQTVNLSVYVSGGVAPDQFKWSGLPSGCVSEDAATLSCTPAYSGVPSILYTVSVTVSDSAKESVPSPSSNLVVSPDPSVGPIYANESTVVSGELVNLSDLAYSRGGAVTWVGLPSGCAEGEVASRDSTPIYASCRFPEAGKYNISVSVTDANNYTVRSPVLELLVTAPAGPSSPPASHGSDEGLELAIGLGAVVAIGLLAAGWFLRVRRSRRPPGAEEEGEAPAAEPETIDAAP